jgi:cobalt-zinc-cadmium efflux system outer membrane protein
VSESLDEGARETLVREAFEHRPDLKSTDLLKKRAQASISLGRRQRIPDLGVWAQYAQEGVGAGAISPPTVTLGLSMPLPLFYQNQGAILKGEADLRNQSLQRAKLEAQVVNGVESSLNAYSFSKKKLERMETSLLPRARRARELVGIQYDKGAASLLELLDAQRTLIAINSEYLQNLTDYWTSVFEIEQAVGRELHR